MEKESKTIIEDKAVMAILNKYDITDFNLVWFETGKDHIPEQLTHYRNLIKLIFSLLPKQCNYDNHWIYSERIAVFINDNNSTNPIEYFYRYMDKFKEAIVTLNTLKSNMSPEETELLYKLLDCEDVFKSVEKYG